jgi:hypothetical protein
VILSLYCSSSSVDLSTSHLLHLQHLPFCIDSLMSTALQRTRRPPRLIKDASGNPASTAVIQASIDEMIKQGYQPQVILNIIKNHRDALYELMSPKLKLASEILSQMHALEEFIAKAKREEAAGDVEEEEETSSQLTLHGSKRTEAPISALVELESKPVYSRCRSCAAHSVCVIIWLALFLVLGYLFLHLPFPRVTRHYH